MLHIGIAVACGSFTLDDIHCVKGDVLYAALEDNKRRLQYQLRQAPQWADPLLKRLQILSAGEMSRLSEGGTALIRAWIEQAPEPKLVVIDVLAKVRDPRPRDQGPLQFRLRRDGGAQEDRRRVRHRHRRDPPSSGRWTPTIRSTRSTRHYRSVRLGGHRAGAKWTSSGTTLPRSRPRHRRTSRRRSSSTGDLHVDGARGG